MNDEIDKEGMNNHLLVCVKRVPVIGRDSNEASPLTIFAQRRPKELKVAHDVSCGLDGRKFPGLTSLHA
jgi:hypothetical protein